MPESSVATHEEILERSLMQLGTRWRQLDGYDLLSGGRSGANTYRLRFSDRDLILKVALPGGPDHLLQGARREVLFYRHLAADVRVRVPDAIASHEDDATGVCLLLTAHEPAPDPPVWTASRFIEVADLLGRCHSAFWDKERELSAMGWLGRDEEPAAVASQRASGLWQRLSTEPGFEAILDDERVAWILRMLERLDEMGTDATPFPNTLCHGDFHSDNILIGHGGGLVLSDWQEVGVGRGPEDLSFFIQRATFSGGKVPVDAMFDAYRRSVMTNTGQDIPLRELYRVADLAELRTRLIDWPEFLIEAPAHQLSDMIERIDVLESALSDKHREAPYRR